MSRLKKAALALGLAVFLCGSAVAQDSSTSNRGAAVISDTTSVPVICGVLNEPYSATETIYSRRTLADGTFVEQTETTKVARDSQGRERHETWRVPPRGDPDKPELSAISILDPVAGVTWYLSPKTRSATRRVPPQPTKPVSPSTTTTNQRLSSLRTAPKYQTEQLGTEEIEGIEVRGTRTTQIIPTGWEGNSAPITVVSEMWFSAELKIPVLSKRTDPLDGDSTMQLSDINRNEPDPTLFQVPADYKIQDQ